MISPFNRHGIGAVLAGYACETECPRFTPSAVAPYSGVMVICPPTVPGMIIPPIVKEKTFPAMGWFLAPSGMEKARCAPACVSRVVKLALRLPGCVGGA